MYRPEACTPPLWMISGVCAKHPSCHALITAYKTRGKYTGSRDTSKASPRVLTNSGARGVKPLTGKDQSSAQLSDNEFEDEDDLGDGVSGAESDGEELDSTPDADGEHQGASPPEDGGEEEPKDYWEQRGSYLVRVHRRPRRTTFSPAHCEDE